MFCVLLWFIILSFLFISLSSCFPCFLLYFFHLCSLFLFYYYFVSGSPRRDVFLDLNLCRVFSPIPPCWEAGRTAKWDPADMWAVQKVREPLVGGLHWRFRGLNHWLLYAAAATSKSDERFVVSSQLFAALQ